MAGPATLHLGMTPEEIAALLDSDHQLTFHRDTLPETVRAIPTAHGIAYEYTVQRDGKSVNVTYRDEFGEHAFIAHRDDPKRAIAMLVFESGRLTRATRLIGPVNSASLSADALLKLVVETLAAWNSIDGQPTIAVTPFHFANNDQQLQELVFVSGKKRLTIVNSHGMTQLVENLGRLDIAFATSEP